MSIGFYLSISKISIDSEVILGKVCLKAVVKVVLSLQRLEQQNQKLIGTDRIRRSLDESTLCRHENCKHYQATT